MRRQRSRSIITEVTRLKISSAVFGAFDQFEPRYLGCYDSLLIRVEHHTHRLPYLDHLTCLF